MPPATAALEGGANVRAALEICTAVAEPVPGRPDGLRQHGPRPRRRRGFAGARGAAGAAGAIVPDLPLGEAGGHPRGLHRRRAGAGAARRADHPAGAPGRIAPSPAASSTSSRPSGPPGSATSCPPELAELVAATKAERGGAGCGRLRDRHAGAGRRGRADRRRGDHRQPPGPRRRRGAARRGPPPMRSPSSCARRASPSPDRLRRAWEWSVTLFLALAAMACPTPSGRAVRVAGLVFFGGAADRRRDTRPRAQPKRLASPRLRRGWRSSGGTRPRAPGRGRPPCWPLRGRRAGRRPAPLALRPTRS